MNQSRDRKSRPTFTCVSVAFRESNFQRCLFRDLYDLSTLGAVAQHPRPTLLCNMIWANPCFNRALGRRLQSICRARGYTAGLSKRFRPPGRSPTFGEAQGVLCKCFLLMLQTKTLHKANMSAQVFGRSLAKRQQRSGGRRLCVFVM